jgi:hypothetical protein
MLAIKHYRDVAVIIDRHSAPQIIRCCHKFFSISAANFDGEPTKLSQKTSNASPDFQLIGTAQSTRHIPLNPPLKLPSTTSQLTFKPPPKPPPKGPVDSPAAEPTDFAV